MKNADKIFLFVTAISYVILYGLMALFTQTLTESFSWSCGDQPAMYLRVMDFHIRTIQPSDNKDLASIVRNTLAEFGANRPGTVYFDASTDRLFEVFQAPRSIYYVAINKDKLVGGAGIFPSEGLPENICELVKMYLLPEARGLGVGRQLIEKCLSFAKEAGYKKVYLETLPELKKAIHVYEKFNFSYLPGPLGNTGHFGCDVWMIREI